MVNLGRWSPLAPLLFKICVMDEPKSIKELIDTYYPEIAKRLKDGKRNGK